VTRRGGQNNAGDEVIAWERHVDTERTVGLLRAPFTIALESRLRSPYQNCRKSRLGAGREVGAQAQKWAP
jgi:hypothetical protein